MLKYEEEVRLAQGKSEAERGIFCMNLFEQSPDHYRTVGKQWCPPAAGVAKLNTDTSFVAATGESAGVQSLETARGSRSSQWGVDWDNVCLSKKQRASHCCMD